MIKMILALAILYPAARLLRERALPPPLPTDRRQAAGRGRVEEAGGQEGSRKPLPAARSSQVCQDIDDATKERLNCYDAIFSPQPKPKAAAAKSVNECRFLKEEDERLTCYNGFAGKNSKLPR